MTSSNSNTSISSLSLTSSEIRSELNKIDTVYRGGLQQIQVQMNGIQDSVSILGADKVELTEKMGNELLDARNRWARLGQAIETRRAQLELAKERRQYPAPEKRRKYRVRKNSKNHESTIYDNGGLSEKLKNIQNSKNGEKSATMIRSNTRSGKIENDELLMWPGWSKAVTEDHKRLPYYLNHKTKQTTWTHPGYIKMIATAGKCFNEIRFAAYRTGFKLRHVQKTLGLDKLDFWKLKEIINFDDKHDKNTPLSDCELNMIELRELLIKLYRESMVTDAMSCIDIVTSFLIELFDPPKKGTIKLIQVKMTLLILSSVESQNPETDNLTVKSTRSQNINETTNQSRTDDLRAEEKHKLIFNEACTLFGGGFMTELDRTCLTELFSVILRLTDILDESATFGTRRAEICSNSLLGSINTRVDIHQYLAWFKSQPQWLIWLSIFFNIGRVEGLDHEMKCSICDGGILGFRYRSLKTFKYNICQDCFLVGKDKTKSYRAVTKKK